jgi:hypothetical protein
MNQNWVAGHLTGGLGNRLFQHAAAAGLAETWKYPLVFYLPACEPTNHGPLDSIFQLFPYVPQITNHSDNYMIPEPPGCVFTHLAFPENPPYQGNYCVDGWRQTPKYFPSSGLRPDFQHALGSGNTEKLLKHYALDSESSRLKTWFIHVRLGDYLILPHHQINIESYYKKALEHIPKDARILLFTDSFQDYEKHLKTMFGTMGRLVEIVKESDELVSLYLMSHCWGGAVVANSTFSWWGAYFARTLHSKPETYKATFPVKWGHGLPEARDIIPSWGIPIQNEA